LKDLRQRAGVGAGSNDKRSYVGLTNLAVNVTDENTKNLQNGTVTIFAGARIKPGDYGEGLAGFNHVTILRGDV
jgi:hypothetical protein